MLINVDVDSEGKIGYQALIPSISQLSEMGIYNLKPPTIPFLNHYLRATKRPKTN